MFRTAESTPATIKSVQFAGKRQLLIEDAEGTYHYFGKRSPLEQDFSFILTFRHKQKVVLLVADKNFGKYPQCLELDNSPSAVCLALSAMCGIIHKRSPSASAMMHRWFDSNKLPLGKAK